MKIGFWGQGKPQKEMKVELLSQILEANEQVYECNDVKQYELKQCDTMYKQKQQGSGRRDTTLLDFYIEFSS